MTASPSLLRIGPGELLIRPSGQLGRFIKAPSFAAIPPFLPGRAWVCSFFLHAAAIAFVGVVSLLFPPEVAVRTPGDLVRESAYEPLTFPELPTLAGGGSSGGREGGGAAAPGNPGAGRG